MSGQCLCGTWCFLPDATNHPCCELWARLTPGKPCQGCQESRDYARKNAWKAHR
jgi:hypothetical protein